MAEGRCIRAQGGYYFLDSGNQVWMCTLRGKLKRQDGPVIPGDLVRFTPLDGLNGVVEQILPRHNMLQRPGVANIDQVIIVMSLEDPKPLYALSDRLLVLAVHAGVDVLLCYTKKDMVSIADQQSAVERYRPLGYRVLITSAKTLAGIPEFEQAMLGKISVLAGPSGVGKSSLLNCVQPGLQLKTGEISPKLGRGRHTTRHVELLPLDGGGWVADTPGFSSLHLPLIPREELDHYFPEIAVRADRCSFASCLHRQEPGCAVRAAMVSEHIVADRYNHYLDFLEEIIVRERTY